MARPRSFDPDAVVTAAMELFWREGYAATTPQALTEATGLGRGSLYNAFDSKHALFLRALRHYEERESARLLAVLEAPGPALTRLRDALMLVASAAQADEERRGCLATNTATELAARDPEVRARVAAIFDGQRAAFARAIAQARVAGDVDPDVDPDAAADFLLTLTNGMRVVTRAGSDPGRLEGVVAHALRALQPGKAAP